jgi:hypothetical protein
MSMKSLEAAILAEARTVFCNPKLRMKDIQEWTTGDVVLQQGESLAYLADLQVTVCVLDKSDKRKKGEERK